MIHAHQNASPRSVEANGIPFAYRRLCKANLRAEGGCEQ
jgi:hypothetical protein